MCLIALSPRETSGQQYKGALFVKFLCKKPKTTSVVMAILCVILVSVMPVAADSSSEGKKVDKEYKTDLDYAQVVFVRAQKNRDGLWRFDVTVRHNDEGWDHYADAWQVVDHSGKVLAERILAHPHETEQPFTRSLSGIKIPKGVSSVIIRAMCTVHGFGGREVVVDLTQAKGKDYEVIVSE